MLWLRRRSLCCCAVAVLAILPAAASDAAFPFGSQLVLDAPPQPGSKRVPAIEIDESGTASFYLWCASASGSASVDADKISIVPTAAQPSQCTPEEISRDAGLLTQLSQVTGWRRQGDDIDLIGATTLHFHLMTN